MKTTNYTDNNIFENNQINALCDLLFQNLVDNFPPIGEDENNYYVFKGVVLSGNAAKIINGGSPSELKNIVFECDEPEIFKFLQKNIQKFFPGKVIRFQNRLLAYPFNYYFEIWLSEGNKETLSSGIYTQQTEFINPETL